MLKFLIAVISKYPEALRTYIDPIQNIYHITSKDIIVTSNGVSLPLILI
jgi:hypothetical protein